MKDGPYSVRGGLSLAKEIIVSDKNGDSIGFARKEAIECANDYALCRCGKSANPPFCDGTHARVNFDGTETAERTAYSKNCQTIRGAGLDLDDLPRLCARARFCHDQEGDVWGNTEGSDNKELKEKAIC